MAIQSSISSLERRKAARSNKTQKAMQEAKTASPTSWVEDTPSFWEALQISLAELTEEDKESIHISLQG